MTPCEEKIDYGFVVGDTVAHLKDSAECGIVTELDDGYDLGGVTTCRVAWGAKTVAEATATPREDQSIHWTNRVFRVREGVVSSSSGLSA